MRNRQTPQLGLDEFQVGFIPSGQSHGVGVCREIPACTLASRVDQLGCEITERQILSDDAVMSEGAPNGARTRNLPDR